MAKGKRGQSETFPIIAYIVLAIMILIPLLFFVNSSVHGTRIKEQILAKQIALLINGAEPGTEIRIPSNSMGVTIDGQTMTVKAERSSGYEYSFFSDNKIELSFEGDILVINIGEKNV